MLKLVKRLRREDGSVLVEALIVVPVFTIFAVGVLEFGNVLWQRNQLQVGVRDAARYWSRCSPDAIGSWLGGPCSVATARNIFVYGNPAGTGNPRVPGWETTSVLTFSPTSLPSIPTDSDIIEVNGSAPYDGSPAFGVLGIPNITIRYAHRERYFGW